MQATQGEIAVCDQFVVSLGVEDIERAKQFFCDGLGFKLERTQGAFAAFKESHGGPLALYSGAPLAYEVELVAREGGYRGVAFSCLVDNSEHVDDLTAQAERAGAKIIKPPFAADWGVYMAYLKDPDGNLWKISDRGSR
jgi:catechol 2,3-dioxygenase-like lactoylglutathione lyase family enzyme